jgi:hypothetical protein
MCSNLRAASVGARVTRSCTDKVQCNRNPDAATSKNEVSDISCLMKKSQLQMMIVPLPIQSQPKRLVGVRDYKESF